MRYNLWTIGKERYLEGVPDSFYLSWPYVPEWFTDYKIAPERKLGEYAWLFRR